MFAIYKEAQENRDSKSVEGHNEVLTEGSLQMEYFKPLISSLAPSLPYCPVSVCSKTAHLLTKIVFAVSLPSARTSS